MNDTARPPGEDAKPQAGEAGLSATTLDPADGLPLEVVDRSQQASKQMNNKLRFGWVFRVLALLVIIAFSILFGGISGLYRQPKPLQVVMEFLGLEPGGGSKNPIALPVDVNSGQGQISGGIPEGSKSAVERNLIIALGRLVPAGEVVTVAPPSGAGDARVAVLKVAEGDRVKRGEIIAVLDNESRLKAAINSAKAVILVREADLVRTRSATVASLDEARAAVASAEAAALSASLDFERTSTLYSKRIVAKSAFDNKLAASQQAQKKVEQAKAVLSRFTSKGIDAQSDVVVAIKNLGAAQAELRRAEQNIDQAYVYSPIAGTVLDIYARAGEKPGAKGVVDIGDIDHMTAKLEVYQADIGAVSLSDRVEIGADAFSGTLIGTVVRIGLQVKRQSVIDSDPAANTDARVVEVVVKLDEKSSAIASKFTNLQIEARIFIEPKS